MSCAFRNKIFLGLFLVLELLLYYLILTSGGDLLTVSCYLSIVLCLAYAITCMKNCHMEIIAGLTCTAMADFFLVVCDPRQQLWGMICFLAAQTMYAIMLHRRRHSKVILGLRIGLIASIELIAYLILRNRIDALVIVSVCYYAILVMNMVHAFVNFRNMPMLAIGFALFILCDTVIGLQTASGGYLAIDERCWLHRVLFMDFNLAWFFYLPSQVLIALSCRKK